jgi:hypothetical protein
MVKFSSHLFAKGDYLYKSLRNEKQIKPIRTDLPIFDWKIEAIKLGCQAKSIDNKANVAALQTVRWPV